MPEFIKCPSCNADLPAGTTVCEYCGTPLASSGPTGSQTHTVEEEPIRSANNTEQFKCPSCGSTLVFDSDTGKLLCKNCSNSYDVGTIKQYAQENTKAEFDWKNYDGALNGVLPEMTVYNCKSCGASIVTDGTSAATHCPYCDNQVVITEKLTGALRPNGIIPFKINKNNIREKVKEFCKGKTLLPKNFFSDQIIDNVQGMYVPVWLYDGTLDGEISVDGKKTRTYTSGNYRYTETSYYLLTYDGKMSFSKVPVDGSAKMPDDLMNSIEPFDYSQIVEFDPQYLSGFLADRYDRGPDESIPDASSRMMNSAVLTFTNAKGGFTSTTLRNNNLKLTDPSVKYVMLPVYVFNCKYAGKLYRFAMNGQTGKLVGELPIDKMKKRLIFWLTALGSGAVAAIILRFLLGWI